MKCNPLRWLWGLLPVALLSWGATQLTHADIEADLKTRVDEQLKGSGFKWARTAFSGRDGDLTGIAADEADPGHAYDIARSVWGVRVVDNRATVIDKVDNYVWSIARAGNTVRLGGFVPNESVRGEIVKVAKTSFAGADIVDEMKLARGVPTADVWLKGVNFGIKQLADLKSGEARLNDLALTVSGAAADLKHFTAVKTALANALPKGVKLVDDRVQAPVVSPFVWQAEHAGDKLVLSGFVPGERARAEMLAAVKASFPRITVVDRMEIAEGAAVGYSNAVILALRQLALLEQGTAAIRDQSIDVRGVAADEKLADDARQGLIKGAPSSYRTSESIKARLVAPNPVSPYTTAIKADAAAVVLSGYAPTEAARDQLAQGARARFPGRRINNELAIAPGAPDGWLGCFDGALAGIARLGAGKLALTDRSIDVAGATDDEELAGSLPAQLKSALRTDCEANVHIDVIAEAVPPLVWRANFNGSEVVLDGDVASAATKTQLAASARRLFGGKSVVDRMRVVETRTRKWPVAAEQGLMMLALLKKGQALLDHQRLSVSGEAESNAQVMRIRDEIGRTLPAGYVGQERVDVAPPAPPRGAAPVVSPPPAVVPARPAPAPVVVAPPPVAKPVVSPQIAVCQQALQSTAREGMIRFERASATLTRESFATLNKLASVVKTCPDVTVQIEGHTDSEGTPERNQGLSDRRAKSVVDYLERGGVAADKLVAIGYGETRPLVPNDSSENRAKNRRIEFTVKVK